MSTDLRLRRHLYEQARLSGGRHRRALRKQIRVLSWAHAGPDDPGSGAAGVREPRRPLPPTAPPAAARAELPQQR